MGVPLREIWNRRIDGVPSSFEAEDTNPSRVGAESLLCDIVVVASASGFSEPGEPCRAFASLSSACLRAAAILFCSRSSAPGDVALTIGTTGPLAVFVVLG